MRDDNRPAYLMTREERTAVAHELLATHRRALAAPTLVEGCSAKSRIEERLRELARTDEQLAIDRRSAETAEAEYAARDVEVLSRRIVQASEGLDRRGMLPPSSRRNVARFVEEREAIYAKHPSLRPPSIL